MLVYLLLHYAFDPLPDLQMWALVACSSVYFALQLAFFPLLRASMRGEAPRNAVRLLLAAACVPLVAIATISLSSSDSALLGVFSVFPALHAIVNDAALFGVLF